jgi:hypothetical protein
MASLSNRLWPACVPLLLAAGLCTAVALPSASTSAQSASSTPSRIGPTIVFADAGGDYEASSYGTFDLSKKATGTDDVATNPQVNIHYEAGAWGTLGREPMAFAFMRASFGTVTPANYLRPAIPLVGYARVACTRDVDPHCECIRPDPDECYHFTISASSVRRPYRLINMSGMSLPGNVSFIPVLVDYHVNLGMQQNGVLPEEQFAFNPTAKVSVSYPDGPGRFTRRLNCNLNGCGLATGNAAPSRGTLEVPVTVSAAEDLLLDLSTTIYLNDRPNCMVIDTLPNDPCLVPPYGGDAWVLVDPYVYIDPSWEYADWFEVQTSADGDEWFTAEPTAVDLSTFGLEGAGGSGGPGGTAGTPAGGPDAGVPDGGTGGANGMVGSGGGAGIGDDGGGGGCGVARSRSSSPDVMLFLMLAAGATIARRRLH